MTTDADRMWPTIAAFAEAQIAQQRSVAECFRRLADFHAAAGEAPADVIKAFRKLARDTERLTDKAAAGLKALDREAVVMFVLESTTDYTLKLLNGQWGDRVSAKSKGAPHLVPRRKGKDPR